MRKPHKSRKIVIELPEAGGGEMVYACLACKSVFNDPGLCPNCNVVLKKKAG